MPYKIIKVKDGYKVALKSDEKKTFSKKPLSKDTAIKQMKAIIISEKNNNNNKILFVDRLKNLGIDKDDYLNEIRKINKDIELSDKPGFKLKLKNKHFGKSSDNDYIIFKNLAKQKFITDDEAEEYKNMFINKYKPSEQIKMYLYN